ncbi:Uncharacterised protein [Corynebacterium imitans]|uniref:Uncharacterized protein n=1 Tax=Corynebacterium imitans TaxID=156978 RepID=A0A076NSD7_9CORY|nr:YqgE/AlgH family protein [Corynebacterium imitans]AIJ34520.1 hypothetical protein CIMIT_12085 [Corynebacterium imitans]MCG7277934.1 YqgE/AlgH family protein [Corynebacterium imitans]SNV52409.1 Uncharacterised protein [Corynebacterium imitans]
MADALIPGDRGLGSLKPGMLLVANPKLKEPLVERSVFLILGLHPQENEAEALMLHLPMKRKVNEYYDGWDKFLTGDSAYFRVGGLAEVSSARFIGVPKEGIDPSAHLHMNPLTDKLAVLHGAKEPERLMRDVEDARMYIGVTYFDLAMLRDDLGTGQWLLADALPEDVLCPIDGDLWSDVMRREPVRWQANPENAE